MFGRKKEKKSAKPCCTDADIKTTAKSARATSKSVDKASAKDCGSRTEKSCSSKSSSSTTKSCS